MCKNFNAPKWKTLVQHQKKYNDDNNKIFSSTYHFLMVLKVSHWNAASGEFHYADLS